MRKFAIDSCAVAAATVLAFTLAVAPGAMAQATSLDGWFAAGKAGLGGQALSGLNACGAGGETARRSFKSFSPSEHAGTVRDLDSGKCDVALSGTPGSTTLAMMQQGHPSRTIYEIRAGKLTQIRAGSDLPPWIGLAKSGRKEVALSGAVLCGTGAWRAEYRRKTKSTTNIYKIEERLQKVDNGSCDLAVFSPEEFAGLGSRAGKYAKFGLSGDNVTPMK